MPTKSPYPDVEIPNIDLWTFLFERKDRPYPEDKGQYSKMIRHFNQIKAFLDVG